MTPCTAKGEHMAFYIYEHWQAGPHKAVIHHGSCGRCNEGSGRAGDDDPAHAKWHGPFESLSDAQASQQGMDVLERKECRCVSSSK